MRQLPDILGERAEGGRVEIDLRVPPELDCLAGHFPGRPILPGVVQLDWSVRLARSRLVLQGGFARAENLKFTSVVWPRSELTLGLELASPTRLRFRYFHEQKTYSSGTLVFGGPQ
jgi:3-hydroxymyristoyl/3-hydroxydecanoyl-(acyl carrier protein) dehydratase